MTPGLGRPGSAPGDNPATGQVVRARQVIVSGPDGGAFFYSGTPAAGNLIASMTSQAGTDGPGNAYLAGITIYSATVAVRMETDGLVAFTATSQAGPWIASNGALTFSKQPWGMDTILAGDAVDLRGPFPNPVIAVTPGTNATAETWHPMTLAKANGWAVQSGAYARYKLLPTNEVWVQAKLVAGTLANGTRIWAPPTGYTPTLTHAQTGKVIIESGSSAAGALSPYVSINSTSGLQVENLPRGLVNCSINFRYALD